MEFGAKINGAKLRQQINKSIQFIIHSFISSTTSLTTHSQRPSEAEFIEHFSYFADRNDGSQCKCGSHSAIRVMTCLNALFFA